MAERNRRKHARYISVSEDELPSSISGGISSNNVHDKSPTSNKYETWLDPNSIYDTFKCINFIYF